MRGVDHGDQRIGYYNLGRWSKKWWKRVFACLVECNVLNAFILGLVLTVNLVISLRGWPWHVL